MQTSGVRQFNPRVLWMIASAAELVAAIFHSIEGDYLRAAPMYCLAIGFLFLAVNDRSKSSRLMVGLSCTFIVIAIGFIVYRFVT